MNKIDNKGLTPLMWAATKGNLEVVKLLLAQNVDLDKISNEGKTALILAAENGRFEIAQHLIDNGADKDIRDQSGETALDKARKKGHKIVIEILSIKKEQKTSKNKP